MVNGCLSTEELLELMGFRRVGDLVRALEDQGIQFFLGKGGKPWTTYALVNAAKGMGQTASSERTYGAESL